MTPAIDGERQERRADVRGPRPRGSGPPAGGSTPDQPPHAQADCPEVVALERQLHSAVLAGSGDAVAVAALALADGLAHSGRAGQCPALLRLAARRGGPGPSGRALLRLGAALTERGADDQARAAWLAAARC